MPKGKEKFDEILKREGLDFIKNLLKFEEHRFDRHFKKGSVFEEINEDFGIFPKAKVYPVYFSGDITKPKNKIIFIGINPAYSEDGNKDEQIYLEKKGSFEGYCHQFEFFKERHLKSRYYENISGFLRRYNTNNAPKGVDWGWYQNNFINLDFIPYHSVNTGGLRVNNIEKYKKIYLKTLLKILDYLNPSKPVFINGISTVLSFLDIGNKRKKTAKFSVDGIIYLNNFRNIWFGKIGKYNCVGLPFLTRVTGGKDALVKNIKNAEKKL